jgi:hypothetical protein
VIAAGAIVDESDHLIPELAVLEHAIGNHAAEIAGAGDENPLQPDPRPPAPLQELPHCFARGIGEHHRQHEKQSPHDL